ncbi:acetyl-CoA C-acyltransferase [Rhodococcus sp. T2V]|uniref:acetyl-CoA C-acyltransferase n=1 Tax=Rhodococcus sp. T2V TaxID=3034164 RepID=UPI0023E21E98|nr:acetyl-CoA C-acyltransferase [Rhodococcus sp. T2V]MDF3312886.1 acetyl-CoA C-acyltransferase [Rhodococcus sp. T2V]
MTAQHSPVLVSVARTPVGRFGGALAHLSALDLGAAAVQAALEPLGDQADIDHTFLGNVVQAGNGQNPARVAAIRGGVPTTVPGTTINDVCLASLTATGMAATLIRAGEIDTALVGGFESMSLALHGAQIRAASKIGHGGLVDLLVNDGLWCAVSDSGMGEISDQANLDHGISRADQDAFACTSHRRATAATESGRFKQEITALTDTLDADEGIRPGTTIDKLARLQAAFTEAGTITAGNASQMSDAAAAGVLMSRRRANALGLAPLVEVVDRVVVAGPDPTLHLKPAAAARKLLNRNGLGVGEVGLWEINEAFAGVVLASARDLGLDPDRVNVNGGAIALGHPLAASGFRILMTLAIEMQSRNKEFGIATICGGGGQGQAILLRLQH